MKASLLFIMPLIALLALLGCDSQPPVIPEPQAGNLVNRDEIAERVSREFIAQAGWVLEDEKGGIGKSVTEDFFVPVTGFRRQPITQDVVHYVVHVRVGSGRYDVIGIHRVVKEKRPFVPIRTADAIFLQHGDGGGFEPDFMPGLFSDSRPDGFGAAVYLAENDVDVWGIDQAWTLVPEGVTDFEFMRDWGIQKHVDDLSFAISVSRFARYLTGSGFSQLILSAYSSGVGSSIALLNQETQLPDEQRNIGGFVSVDLGIKLPESSMRDYIVADGEFQQGLHDAGQYQYEFGLEVIGQLAETDPDSASPIIPGLTNLQVALFIGAGQVFGPDVSFHYVAGVLDDTGFPIGLQLLTVPEWLDFLQSAVPFEPTLYIAEIDALISDAWPIPFDDYFSEITVPIFNIGAKGGFGELTEYGTTLLGSTDITHLIVEIPSPDIRTDFGHIDLVASDDAMTKVWQPMLDWIREHTPPAVAQSQGRTGMPPRLHAVEEAEWLP